MTGSVASDYKNREEFSLHAISYKELPGWENDNHLEALQTYNATTNITTNCEACSYFEQNFIPYKVNDNQQGLFTGYFEPVLNGSRTKSAQYNVPIYRRPPELVVIEDLGTLRSEFAGTRIAGTINNGTLIPYYTRGEIMDGAIEGKDLEILWVDSQVDAFFMAIQGSGRIKLPDGSMVKLSYDGANGYPYTAIGKVLLDQGNLDRSNVTMESIKDWLIANPDKIRDVLATNQSYIFFKEIDDKGHGPIGSCGIELTPERSLAVDKRYVDLGTPVWLDINHPENGQIQRLMVAQDSGSAIKGTVRGDYYWGTGKEAGKMAGKMKSRGNFYILKPRADCDV